MALHTLASVFAFCYMFATTLALVNIRRPVSLNNRVRRENFDPMEVTSLGCVISTGAEGAATTTTSLKHPAGTTYCQCATCKTAYLLSAEQLGNKSIRVRCAVCNKDWFQSVDRLYTSNDMHEILPMSPEKVQNVRKILAEKNLPKYPRVDKVGLFVGNLPYSYTEKDIEELFAEYGLVSIALVRDPEQNSKGFAFIDVSNMADAQQVLQEMNDFYVEPNKKLTVRMYLQFLELISPYVVLKSTSGSKAPGRTGGSERAPVATAGGSAEDGNNAAGSISSDGMYEGAGKSGSVRSDSAAPVKKGWQRINAAATIAVADTDDDPISALIDSV